MKLLIVDDEPLARERLRALVGELAVAEVCGEAGDGEQALALVEREAPDIVLLDIRMPGMDGLEVARHLARMESPPAVVFTTAYDGHALAAFEAQAIDYLLKPIRRQRLAEALERAGRPTRAQLAGLHAATGDERPVRTHISATLHGSLQLVPVEAVRFFRAEHKYVTARHPRGYLLIEESLFSLEEEFGERFVRVHRNALVCLGHVTAMEQSAAGAQVLRFDGVEDTVEVSRRLLATVRRALRSRAAR